MADSTEAREALYDAITKMAKQLEEDGNPYSAAEPLRDLAWGWRALVGGTQPGVSVIEK